MRDATETDIVIKTINEVIEDAIIADGFGDQTVWEQAKRIIDALDAAGFEIQHVGHASHFADTRRSHRR